jgi:predicted GNAT family acetyltransferase
MEVVRFDDAVAFLAEAEPLLLADEARHNLILGIAGTIRDSPDLYPLRSLWLVRKEGRPVGAALRTPPYNLILARPESPHALDALAGGCAEELPGVNGCEPEVHDFAELWAARTAARPRTNMRQGVYALEQVEPLPGVPGSARVATADDRELVLRWWIAFGEEVLHEGGPHGDNAESMVDHRLSAPGRGFLLWEDGGDVVSLAGWGGATPNGIRVGPVYTPPELRGRGYATALTAELSQRLLDGRLFEGGRRFCFLYTDLANPTSNAIYERIGYRRKAESAEVVFERG